MTASDGGYYGWIAVFSCFFHHAFVSSAVYGLSVYYGTWVEDFDTGRGITSWVLTLGIAFSMGTGPVVSSLCTRFGHRMVIIAGSAVCATGFFITTFVKSIYAVVLLIGGLSGFGLGLQYLPSVAIIPFFFSKRRSFAMGIGLSGAGVGVFLYPPFLIWLEEQYTWRGAMLILSGISLNMIVCAALLKPVDESANDTGSGHCDAGVPCALSETEPLEPNCHVKETQDLAESFAGTYDAVDLSGVNDTNCVQDSSLSHIKSCGLSKCHLADSCHNVYETGSYRSLGRSHLDIFLSTSHFNLTEVDTKRAEDSFHQLEIKKSQEISKPDSFSCSNSFHHLSSEHDESSSQKFINHAPSTCDSSQRKLTQCDKLSSNCLPVEHLEMLKNPYFLSIAISFFLFCLTALVPVAYIVDRAVENGVDKTKAAFAFSMYGAGNLFGRIAVGVLADQGLDSLLLCAACLALSGISTCLSPLCGANAILHGLYGFIFGTCTGGSITLNPIILVDLFGVKSVNRSYGLLLVFNATGLMIGTPIAGWVYDATKSYTFSFIFHGVIVVVAAVILVMMKIAVLHSRKNAAAAAIVAAAISPGDIKVNNPNVDCAAERTENNHKKESKETGLPVKVNLDV